jgi:FkbM family methyltransferase
MLNSITKLIKQNVLGKHLILPALRNVRSLLKIIKYNYVYYSLKGRKRSYNGLTDFLNQPSGAYTKLIFMDIGARGEVPREWLNYKSVVSLIGFEPDEQECKRLNETALCEATYYPYFIGDGTLKIFKVANFPPSSGIYEIDLIQFNRLYDTVQENLRTIEDLPVKTVTVDDLVSSQEIPLPDFIKIDTEGYEAECLENSTFCFENGLLGLYTEIWLGSLKNNADSLCRIDQLCRKYGLHLYQIYTDHSRTPRATLQKKFTFKNSIVVEHSQDFGQRLAIDCLYLRDPIYDYFNESLLFKWTDENIIKMLLIYECYSLHDCALELLEFYAEHFQTSLPVDNLKNLLIPRESNPRGLTFNQYRTAVEAFENHETIFRPHRRQS